MNDEQMRRIEEAQRRMLEAQQGRKKATNDDEEDDKPTMSELAVWLAKLGNAGKKYITPAQAAKLDQGYEWLVTRGSSVTPVTAPAPNIVFAEQSARGENFRNYLNETIDKIRNNSRLGRVGMSRMVNIVRGWRYDRQSNGISESGGTEPTGGIDPFAGL